MNMLRRLRTRINRRSHVTVWGDSRSLPFTEGQAVVGAGLIGPANLNMDFSRTLG